MAKPALGAEHLRMTSSPHPSPHPSRYSVALLGFGAFERQGLEACFRLLARREPGFVLAAADAPLAEADWVVVNGDQPEAAQAVWASGQLATAVVIGASALPGAALHLPRPIDPLALQRGLESLAGVDPEPTTPLPATRLATGPGAAESGRRFEQPVLVVDDSEVARQYLRVQLERLGCAVHTAVNADEARAQLARQTYAAVFVDLALDPSDASELEGLVLCHELQQVAREPRPRVVVVSARSSGTDRVRATLAGCDSFRVKPVSAAALEEELQQVEVTAATH